MTTLIDLNFFNRFKFHAWQLVVLLVVGIYLGYTFIGVVDCPTGIGAVCTMSDFGVVLPFYLLFMFFNIKFNLFGYILLYMISSVVYLEVIYYLTDWAEQVYLRNKNRVRFTLKQI